MKFGTSRREPIRERARGCGSSSPKDLERTRCTRPASQTPTSGVEVRKSRGCSFVWTHEVLRTASRPRAVRWGGPEVILNRRRDVREGEITPRDRPVRMAGPADVVSELDGIVSCRGTLAAMAVVADHVERTEILVEPRDGVPRDGGPAGRAAPRTPAGATPPTEQIPSVRADHVSERRVDSIEIKVIDPVALPVFHPPAKSLRRCRSRRRVRSTVHARCESRRASCARAQDHA